MARPIPMATKVYGLLILAALLAATAAAKVIRDTPKHHLRRRRPTNHNKALSTTATYVPTLKEQQEYLRAHNDIRRSMGIAPLAWDAKLAAVAHSWAEKRRVDCNYRNHSKSPYGENIFFMKYREYSPRDIVQLWYNENTMYDARAHRCRCFPEREGCECGHYLNVIWSTTKRVGCSGLVYCNNQRGVYIVCEYDPPGLAPGINPFTGKPLSLGVGALKSALPRTRSFIP